MRRFMLVMIIVLMNMAFTVAVPVIAVMDFAWRQIVPITVVTVGMTVLTVWFFGVLSATRVLMDAMIL